MKKCSQCKHYKPLADYYKDKREHDGYLYICKECHCKRTDRYRKIHTKHRLESLEEISTVQKQCSVCKNPFLLISFPIDSRTSDGYRTCCKECNRKRKRQYYYDNQEKILQKRKENSSQQKAIRTKSLNKKIQAGMCKRCTNPKLPNVVTCLDHWVYSLVSGLISRIDPTKTNLRPLLVAHLLQLARNTPHCPITGEPLIPGQTMSLEHKIPVSKAPHLALEAENLQWTSITYNFAKNKMSPDEFNKKYKLVYIGD
jgi:hypothetical protein